MSETTLEQHRQKWSDLPTFAEPPQCPVTDDDTEFWSDLEYLRGLLDSIIDQSDRTGLQSDFQESVIVGELQPDETLDPVYSPVITWPHDNAADLLAVWRGAAVSSEAVQ